MKRIVIVCDGKAWYVRRLRVIERDVEHDEKIYRCDKPLGNDYPTLADVPMVRELIEAAANPKLSKRDTRRLIKALNVAPAPPANVRRLKP